MPPQYVYTMKGLGKRYPPDRTVLKDIWLSFLPGAKIGVLGANGAGKSTLLRIMAGEITEFDGEAFPAQGLSVGYLPQEPRLDASKTVSGNVNEGVGDMRALLKRYDQIASDLASSGPGSIEMEEALEEQGELQSKIDAMGAWDLDSRVQMAMDALRLPPGSADVTTLSGGERRRVALCRLLLQSPDLLLLDEPTNHLDAESVAWLERFLADYPGTVVAVTHDRYFLDNVAGWILELDRGAGIPWEGNYSSWLAQKQQRLDVEAKHEAKRRRTLRRELEWIAMSPRARQAKGKARLNAYERLLAEDTAQKIDSVEIYVPPGPRLGEVVVEATDVIKGYGDRALIGGLSFTLPPAGIVGRGGSERGRQDDAAAAHHRRGGARRGRDSARRHRAGRLRRPGPRARPGADRLGGDLGRPGRDHPREAHGRLARLRLVVQLPRNRPAAQGWERCPAANGTVSTSRRLLRGGANLLLLDEPTNDLDVDTLRALEDALVEFAGCLVVVSHDRWFLDRIATHIIAFEGDSEVVWFAGNHADYEADRRRRLGRAADQPHRIRFRKLTRV